MAAMHDLDRFGRRYARFIRLAHLIATVLPPAAQPASARLLGRYYSPFRVQADRMKASMKEALSLDSPRLERAWSDWLENHGLFAVSVFHYRRLQRWATGRIRIEGAALLDELAAHGGLVLSYHCHHQNTVAAVIGMRCGNVWPLAVAAEASPLYPYIGAYIDLINRDSQSWFGNGRYLYLDKPRHAVREMRAVLASRQILLALCDSDYPTGMPVTVFGKRMRPSVAAIRIAKEYARPIVAALMVPDGNALTLHLCRLPQQAEVAEIAAAYIGFLEMLARRYPSCWQGWEWWGDLPLAKGYSRDD